MANSFRLGIDVGGTFTDLIAFREDTGDIVTLKVPSTPQSPSQGVMNGLAELAKLDPSLAPQRISFLAHGTTVTTNALLEMKGARTALLVTQGFRGIYEVRDQSRPPGWQSMDLYYEKPAMLVPQKLTWEVPERIGFDGRVLADLDEERVAEIAGELRFKGVESVAVCYLFSFANPKHEMRTKQILREAWPDLWISVSSDVNPQIREYPRLSTTVLDAYVGPVLSRYALKLEGELQVAQVTTSQKFIMQSHGGLLTFQGAAASPVRTLVSGPAAGVIGGAQVGLLAGYKDVVTLDMGGTSADIGVVREGQPLQSTQGQVAGQPVSLPLVDLATIGAGGGTIARVGKDGLLKVGPESAGAHPGPACYGYGGLEPTVTDANVVLGYLNQEHLLGGRLPIDAGLSWRAVEELVAGHLGMSTVEAAQGIFRVINVKMEVQIRLSLIQKGYDPRRFAMVAFGGAGPVHAPQMARDLKIPKVIVPPWPGLTSTMGLLMTELKHDYLLSRFSPLLSLSAQEMENTFGVLEAKATSDLRSEGYDPKAARYLRALDLRYAGQAYELTVPLAQPRESRSNLEAIRNDFDQLHFTYFGRKAEGEPVEVVNFRLVATVDIPQLQLREAPTSAGRAETASLGSRRAYFTDSDGFVDTPLFWRESLATGSSIQGPAIIEQADSTTVLLPGQSATVDRYRDLIVDCL